MEKTKKVFFKASLVTGILVLIFALLMAIVSITSSAMSAGFDTIEKEKIEIIKPYVTSIKKLAFEAGFNHKKVHLEELDIPKEVLTTCEKEIERHVHEAKTIGYQLSDYWNDQNSLKYHREETPSENTTESISCYVMDECSFETKCLLSWKCHEFAKKDAFKAFCYAYFTSDKFVNDMNLTYSFNDSMPELLDYKEDPKIVFSYYSLGTYYEKTISMKDCFLFDTNLFDDRLFTANEPEVTYLKEDLQYAAQFYKCGYIDFMKELNRCFLYL